MLDELVQAGEGAKKVFTEADGMRRGEAHARDTVHRADGIDQLDKGTQAVAFLKLVPPVEIDDLTEKGERQSLVAGKALKGLGVELDVCLTSPKVRARRTAELACQPLGVPVVYGYPLGHTKHLAALPLGVTCTLDADAKTLTVDEPALRDREAVAH